MDQQQQQQEMAQEMNIHMQVGFSALAVLVGIGTRAVSRIACLLP
jgi:hypothetical protein